MGIITRSLIFSDSWPNYSKITLIKDYMHAMVNHKCNFVDPDNTELHTNNIKSSWKEGN